MSYKIAALLTGKAALFRGDESSAIAKLPVSGPVMVGRLGLAGDEQADRKHHGGPHMAVHLYSQDHYSHWRTLIGDHPLLDAPGAFGENIAAHGLTEDIARIGDRYRLGSVLLEISQPRQPCWKIEHRFGRKGMVADILKTSRCGIYLRVLEEGLAQADDTLELIEPGPESWTVRRVFSALHAPMAKTAAEEYTEIAGLERLSPELRERAKSHLK